MCALSARTIISDDEIIVVYDMDDVLWGYSEVAAKCAGVDINKWTNFHVEAVQEFTHEQRLELRAVIGRTDFYDQIEFYPGVDEILRPQELSPRVRVEINSNVVSEQATGKKRVRLYEAIPRLTERNLVFGLVHSGNPASTLHKQFNPKALIVTDDSPYNIIVSPAPHNILPTKPWNTSLSAVRLLESSPISYRYASDLRAINQMVYTLVEDYLRQAS